MFTLLHKASILYSSLDWFYQKFQNLKNIFTKNGYSVSFTGFWSMKYLDKLHAKKEAYLFTLKI